MTHPHENHPEAHCLSALMKSASDVYAAIAAGLTAAHFTVPRLATVFEAILRAASEVKDTSVAALVAFLPKGDNAITLHELCTLDDLQPTSINRATLVAELIGAGKRRKLLSTLTAALTAAKESADASFEDMWGKVGPHLAAAQSTTAETKARSLADMAAAVIAQIKQPDTRKLVPTGFQSWDRLATPLRAGEMVTIAARPGCGKTAIAIQIAERVAVKVGRVAFFSLEMSGEELVDRLAKLRGGRATLLEEKTYTAAVEGVSRLGRLHVYDNAERHTIAAIEARSRLLASLNGGLSAVVIDYLGLVEPSDRRVPREQQVAEMSRRLKQLAGALQCPVIVLAQLNRESEKDERRPRLSDLRESGAIEQDSDRVWFLWQDARSVIPGTDDAAAIELSLIQAKCRGGPPNVAIRMRFDRPVFTFTQIKSS